MHAFDIYLGILWIKIYSNVFVFLWKKANLLENTIDSGAAHQLFYCKSIALNIFENDFQIKP